MRVERVPGCECKKKKKAAFRKTLPLVAPGNVSEAEENSCSLGLDEGTNVSSNRSSPVEFGEKSEVETR